jgi:hypothetical protein
MRRSSMPLVALIVAWLTATAMAQEVTYRRHIRPLFEEQCASCHGKDAPCLGDFAEKKDHYVSLEKGPRMNSFAELVFFIGWPDTGAIMRRLDDGKSVAGSKPGNMYEHLGDDEPERQQNLKLFRAWVGEDAWTLKRWNARGDVLGVTKDELSKMKLKY